jgi:DNA repair protein RadC
MTDTPIATTPTLPGLDPALLKTDTLVKPFKFPSAPYEYKVVPMRECPVPDKLLLCDTPDKAAEYWRLNIATDPRFNPEAECLAVLLLNVRRRVKGHQIVTIGTHDTLLVHPVAVFRLAVMTCAAAVVLMHNHPSGEPSPSDADIKVTRDLIRAGQLLKVEVCDHVIMGNPNRSSLRELGYWAGF